MEKETISIVGCGWLGLSVAKLLLKEGYRVKGSTTSPEKLEKLEREGIQPFLYPGAEGEVLDALFGAKILVLTFPPSRRGDDIVRIYREQIRSTAELAGSAGVERVLFISSTGVYGPFNGVLEESLAPQPGRPTAQAMLGGEQELRARFGARLTVLRMAGLAGDDRLPGRFLAGKQDVRGGLSPVNLVHREDAARAALEVIRQGAWGKVFNVCADRHPLKKDFYPQKARELGLAPPSFLEEGSTPERMISNRRIKEELGFTFIHPDPMGF